MPDHEIRLRMNRGKVPQARLEITTCQRITADQEFTQRCEARTKLATDWAEGRGRIVRDPERLDAPKRDFDEFEVQFAVANSGEVTIRDFLLDVRTRIEGTSAETGLPTGEGGRFRFAEIEHAMPNQKLPERKLFPGDRIPFPPQKWSLRVPTGTTLPLGTITVHWTVFLDDCAPIEGVIDLAAVFQE